MYLVYGYFKKDSDMYIHCGNSHNLTLFEFSDGDLLTALDKARMLREKLDIGIAKDDQIIAVAEVSYADIFNALLLTQQHDLLIHSISKVVRELEGFL